MSRAPSGCRHHPRRLGLVSGGREQHPVPDHLAALGCCSGAAAAIAQALGCGSPLSACVRHRRCSSGVCVGRWVARFIPAASARTRPSERPDNLQETMLFLLLAGRSPAARPSIVLSTPACTCVTRVYTTSGSVIHSRGRRWPRCAANRGSHACNCRRGGVTRRTRGCSDRSRGRDDTFVHWHLSGPQA